MVALIVLAPHLPHAPHLSDLPFSSLLAAQQPDALARQVNDRMLALQREAQRLATQSGTLVGQVRKLEIERDIRIEQAKQAEAVVAAAKLDLQVISDRLVAVEQHRATELPDLKNQLVDIYKRGRTGYLRLLLRASDVREFARASRAVAALAERDERLVADHKRTVVELRAERTALELKMRDLRAQEVHAREARALAERAVGARSALIEQIDSRRDLAAQYIGELQVAHERIEQQVAALAAGRAAEPVTIPIAPFRGTLEWPVSGSLIGRFGQPSGRTGGSLVRNGIEIAAPEGTQLRAVHPGTVSYAEGFTGLGTVVIVDHGANNSSVYGYLSSLDVQRGDSVAAGAEIGRVGSSPTGAPALYFEMRIDGRFVDPVQWLRPR